MRADHKLSTLPYFVVKYLLRRSLSKDLFETGLRLVMSRRELEAADLHSKRFSYFQKHFL